MLKEKKEMCQAMKSHQWLKVKIKIPYVGRRYHIKGTCVFVGKLMLGFKKNKKTLLLRKQSFKCGSFYMLQNWIFHNANIM